MKAVHVSKFGDSEVLKIVDNVPRPSPAEDEILIRVHSVGVNPVDVYVRSGEFPLRPTIPYIPSSDVAGEIVDIGGSVNNPKLTKGQRVFGYNPSLVGASAEYAVVPFRTCGILPDFITYDQGAAIGIPYLTAYDALFNIGKGKSGDSVLIHGGSGGVGMAAIDLCLSKGLDVYATAGTQKGLDVLKSKGVKNVFNHKEAGYCEKMTKANQGKGFNLILEMLANANLKKDCELLANFGKVMVIGSRGTVDGFDPFVLMGKCISIHGVAVLMRSQEELNGHIVDIEKMLQDKHLNPVIGKTYAFGDVKQLHDDLMCESGKHGKLILSMD